MVSTLKAASILAVATLYAACGIYYVETREEPHAGAVAPDFSLPDTEGEVHTLSEMAEEGPVVVLFYRGYW